MVDLSKVRAGDKVILRDGSKIVVDDRGGQMEPLVMTHYLSAWTNDGRWSELNPNCGFDIVAVIYAASRERPTTTDS